MGQGALKGGWQRYSEQEETEVLDLLQGHKPGIESEGKAEMTE